MGRRYDSAKFIALGILLIFIIAAANPLLFSIAFFVIIIAILIAHTNNINPDVNLQNINRGTTYVSRQTALESVTLYLAPHTSIWKNLRISNKYCILRLGSDGETIIGLEKSSSDIYRKFRIVESKVHTMQEVWDMFCLNYSYNTSYDGLIELCNIFNVKYVEEVHGKSNESHINLVPLDKDISFEKLDINNASEVEITALPGISIVLSKKLIKKREEIGGFKTIEDVFLFLKLKPHMEKQLRSRICVKKMEGSINIERTKERKIDL